MKKLLVIGLLVATGANYFSYQHGRSSWLNTEWSYKKHCLHALYEAEPSSDPTGLKGFIMDVSVPTFNDPESVQSWSNRYDPDAERDNTIKYIEQVDHDQTICVTDHSPSKTHACFSLYDITER